MTNKPRSNRREAARGAVGELTPGVDISILTEGDFDFVDAIELVAALAEAPRIDLIVWTANSSHVARLAAVADLRLVIDPGFFLCRPPEEVAAMKAAAPEWRAMDCHLKAALVHGAERAWAVRSSANLNPNRRSELLEITDAPEIVDVLARIMDAAFDAPNLGDPEKAALSDYDRHIPWMIRDGMVSDLGTVTV